MAGLIFPDEITFTARITEAELRKRLALEVMQGIGAVDDYGNPAPGVTSYVNRGEGRSGGYTITIKGPAPKPGNLLSQKGARE